MNSPLVPRPSSRFLGIRIDPYFWLVLAFSLFAVLPLSAPDYFFQAHDAPHTVFFLTEFDSALRDGVWYPGWATDQALGYGYPTFVFYSPLPYYVAEVFHLLGAGKVVAVKWTWALATVGAGMAMYAYARHVLGRQRGLLAAIVYVYVPYHLADIYVRAALAEYCAFVWMPLALLAFHRLVEQPGARRMALAGLVYGALLMSHNVTGLVFTPALAAYVVFCLLMERRPQPSADLDLKRSVEPEAPTGPSWTEVGRRGAMALGGAFLGLGIAAALLLPSFLERRYIVQEQWVQASYDYAQHFVYPFQFVSPFWGYGAAGPGPVDGMSFQLGAVPLVLAAAAVLAALWRPARERALIFAFAAATVLLIVLMLPISALLWRILPIASLIQFPWRLLALTAVTLALLSGLAVPSIPGAKLDARVMVMVLVAMLGSLAYTVPQYTPVPASAEGPQLTLEFEKKFPDMVGMTAWSKKQPSSSPLVVQYESGAPLVTAQALAPGASVEMIRAGGASDELWVRSPEGTALQFYTYYFPGWRVTLDGQRLPSSALRAEPPYGLLTVDMPPGEHRVLLRWADTPVRAMGKGLTLACLALSLILLVLRPVSGAAARFVAAVEGLPLPGRQHRRHTTG